MSLELSKIIELAYLEDMPQGDVTTDSLGVTEVIGKVKVVAKSDLILSGTEVFTQCIHFISPNTSVKWLFTDGQKVLSKQNICTLKGNLLEILKAERVALNFLGKLSGISTLTYLFQSEVQHTNCHILDTRKTTPLLRELEKKAVLDGGGKNHRKNLSEFIMIKENHVRVHGDLKKTIDAVRKKSSKFIVVEAHSLEDVKICVELQVDRILLDNMSNDQMKEALDIIPDFIEAEASGNMNLERVRDVANLGVDYISVGSITHSVATADISMIFEFPENIL